MPRPKGSKNIVFETRDFSPPYKVGNSPLKLLVNTLDETMPTDSGLTNNQVRAAIRETRAKVNEIINILNAR